MDAQKRTKKSIVAATMATALTLVGLHAAIAAPGKMTGPGSQHPCPQQVNQMDAETMKARDAFLADTVELRKAMAEKRAAMRALMNGSSPDQAQAAKLAGELFDLREQINTKARAAGLPAHMMMGMGKMGYSNGPMMGSRHHGGPMM